ncbi:cbb3-type cytochrome c oxidase subunit II [Oleiharenicola sp. Vm1]|uniref:cbb3-type cytochrome c oxidase subunit II n=1 Tax=Oleiharenicola sp. Vm1 TaxID=3398393 RepID=UPI0039F5A387
MKNGLALFFGAFAVLALSTGAVLYSAHKQLGSLTQYKDPVEETLYPAPLTGLADQGRAVYQDLGCVSCHTQQVRRDGFGGDTTRQWGTRQSVARDYIREKTVFLGSSRIGPDLRNVAARAYADEAYLYTILYAPHAVAPGTNMPSYDFLFDVHPIRPGQASPHALKLTGKAAPAPGYEVVPTHRARALVAYLRSLNDAYEYPEAKPFVADAKKEEGK